MTATQDVPGTPWPFRGSLWLPLKLEHERGEFVVHLRPPKKLLLEPREMWHCIMLAASVVGTGLLARGIQLLVADHGLSAATLPIAAARYDGTLAAIHTGVGAALLAASLVCARMSPERKKGPSHDEAGPRLLPRFAFHCAWMSTTPVPCETLQSHLHRPAPVSRAIVQAWFGDASKLASRDTPWRGYARASDYAYNMVTAGNLWDMVARGDIELSDNNAKILRYEFDHENWWAVSDIVRYGWLVKHGGIYVDVDTSPPTNRGCAVDLFDVMGLRGLTVISEEFGRDCGA